MLKVLVVMFALGSTGLLADKCSVDLGGGDSGISTQETE